MKLLVIKNVTGGFLSNRSPANTTNYVHDMQDYTLPVRPPLEISMSLLNCNLFIFTRPNLCGFISKHPSDVLNPWSCPSKAAKVFRCYFLLFAAMSPYDIKTNWSQTLPYTGPLTPKYFKPSHFFISKGCSLTSPTGLARSQLEEELHQRPETFLEGISLHVSLQHIRFAQMTLGMEISNAARFW